MTKKRTKESFTKSLSTIIIDKSLEIIAYFVVSIGLIIYLLMRVTFTKNVVLLLTIGVTLSIALLVWLYRMVTAGDGVFTKIFKWFRRFKIVRKYWKNMHLIDKDLHNFFIEHKKNALPLFFMSLVGVFLVFIEYAIVLFLLDYHLTITKTVLVLAFTGLSYLTPFPGAVGVLEGVEALIFTVVGLTPAKGLAFTLVLRAGDIFYTIIGSIFIFWVEMNHIIKQIIDWFKS